MGEEILPIPHPRFDLLSSPLLCGFLFFFPISFLVSGSFHYVWIWDFVSLWILLFWGTISFLYILWFDSAKWSLIVRLLLWLGLFGLFADASRIRCNYFYGWKFLLDGAFVLWLFWLLILVVMNCLFILFDRFWTEVQIIGK